RTAAQTQQVQSALLAHQAEQEVLSRHLLLSLSTQMSTMNARQIDREREAAEQVAQEAVDWDRRKRQVGSWAEVERRRLAEEVRGGTRGRPARLP
ncbi:MAG: hypothetical protein M3483_04745, partial [Gemmatimonadota bacterium]|nr:hypothetical protein [Gemmatimonadota bacterium]